MFQFQFSKSHVSFSVNTVGVFLGMLLWCGISHTVHASVSYSILPRVIDEKVQPRDIITKEITIDNTGTQPVTLYPSVNNISLKDGAIEAFLAPVESDRATSLASWIEISRLGVDLFAGTKKTVPLTLRIAPNAVPGTYHAFIGFGNGGNRDEAEMQVKNGNAPGIVVTVTISDDKVTFLKLSKFIVSRFVTTHENQAGVFTFVNPGDETVIPTGEVILYDMKGEEVGAIPVNTEQVSIPPGGEHTFNATVPVDGLLGKYKAFLSVQYGSAQTASLQDTSYFYIFPIRSLMITFGVFALIVCLIAWYLHKKYFDNDDAHADSEYLTVHVRDTKSEPKEHDLHLIKKS